MEAALYTPQAAPVLSVAATGYPESQQALSASLEPGILPVPSFSVACPPPSWALQQLMDVRRPHRYSSRSLHPGLVPGGLGACSSVDLGRPQGRPRGGCNRMRGCPGPCLEHWALCAPWDHPMPTPGAPRWIPLLTYRRSFRDNVTEPRVFLDPFLGNILQ